MEGGEEEKERKKERKKYWNEERDSNCKARYCQEAKAARHVR